MSDDCVNLKQAAAALGVHYMTAYRYVRQGRLVAHRQGTEWEIPRAALDAFRTTTELVRGQVATAGSGDWAGRLESCMLAADEVAGWQVLEMALAAGRTPAFCYTEMLAAALASIGERCAADTLDAADQHLATAVAMRLIARLGARFRRRGRSRGTFVFGAPSEELHSVPIAIVADLVRLGGYDVLELGANVPAEAFASCAARVPRLIAIGIGVSQRERLGAVRATAAAIRAVDANVPIIVGGMAARELELEGIGEVTAFAKDGLEALALIESLGASRAIRRIV